MNYSKQPWNHLPLIILACLTIGLAPYFPSPHFFGKVKWILGGADGMGVMDWLDFVFHGIPWILLIRFMSLKVSGKL